MSVHRRTAQNVRRIAEHSAERHNHAHLGVVRRANPFQVELHDAPHLLIVGVDLVITQWVKFYDRVYGIRVDDNALVDNRHGVYVWFDVVSDTLVPPPPDPD